MTNFLKLIFCVLAVPAVADEAMEKAYQDWATQRDMYPAALVAFDASGHISSSIGLDTTITTPMPVASISKTIFGQCVMEMARRGTVSLDNPVSDYLGWSGPQGTVTLRQLLTHTSGIGPDTTQQDTSGAMLADPAMIGQVVETVATRPLAGSSGSYAYNNENYLVLEAALTRAVGSDVLDWCANEAPSFRALRTLERAPSAQALGMAGGLAVSARDLALFFRNLPSEPAADWPVVPIAGVNSYGPGVIIQSVVGGANMFHVGGICTTSDVNLGAYAVRMSNGTSVAMLYSGCISSDDLAFLNSLALGMLTPQ